MKKLLLSLLLVLGMATAAMAADTTKPDPENIIHLDLVSGRVVIQMHPEWAPKHVARIKDLIRQGFYNGLVFHRVIPGFMAQTGDPTGTGAGGSGQNIPAEFNPTPFTRGIVGMARAADVNSADSQFFIMFDETSSLNGQYTAWGQVIDGMGFVDKIRKGDPSDNGKVNDPDRIVKMQLAVDEGLAAQHLKEKPPAVDDPMAGKPATSDKPVTDDKK